MALFSDDEFKVLPINPFDKNFVDNPMVKQIFGKLNPFEEKVAKYIILLYESKSPLRQKITNLSERKKECAELVGLKQVDQIFDLSYPNIITHISSYMRHQQSKVWSVLVANEEVLWQYQSELLTPITTFKTDKDKLQALDMKSRLMVECDAIIKRIDSYEEKLFGDNLDKKEEIIAMTPESIANV